MDIIDTQYEYFVQHDVLELWDKHYHKMTVQCHAITNHISLLTTYTKNTPTEVAARTTEYELLDMMETVMNNVRFSESKILHYLSQNHGVEDTHNISFEELTDIKAQTFSVLSRTNVHKSEYSDIYHGEIMKHLNNFIEDTERMELSEQDNKALIDWTNELIVLSSELHESARRLVYDYFDALPVQEVALTAQKLTW